MQQLHPIDLAQWLQRCARAPGEAEAAAEACPPVLLDVREPWEVGIASLPGSQNIPMSELPSRIDEVDTARTVVCVCHHGVRSMHVALFLARHGFDPIFNLAGGIDAWAREVDPNCPTY